MGAAKKRGTFEERKQAALVVAAVEVPEEVKQQMRDHLAKLAVEDDKANRQMIQAYWKYAKMDERILHKAATPSELAQAGAR